MSDPTMDPTVVEVIERELAKVMAVWEQGRIEARLTPVEARLALIEGRLEYLTESLADVAALQDSMHHAEVDRAEAKTYTELDYLLGGYARALEELTGVGWGDHARGACDE